MAFDVVGGAIALLRFHKIVEIVNCVAHEPIKHRMGLRRHIRNMLADKAPQDAPVGGVAGAHEFQEQRESHRQLDFRRVGGVDVPHGIGHPQRGVLTEVGGEMLEIFIHIARDDIEIQPFGFARLVIHEVLQAFGTGIAQPFIDGQPVAFRLRYLLAFLVEEELVVEAFGRFAAQHAADLSRQLHGIDEILAGHFIIDIQRVPAHAPVGLPLQLAVAAGHRRFETPCCFRIAPDDRAGFWIAFFDGHLHDLAGLRMKGEKR